MSTIELFNPNDKPFGRLSNNAYHPMTIDGKKYDTVTNYIYSNMLTTPTFRNTVQNAKIYGSAGVNKELMTAIDFLMGQSNENVTNKYVSDDTIIKTIVKNSEYSEKDVKSWDKRKQYDYYQRAKASEELLQSGGEKLKDVWVDYAKETMDRDSENQLKKRNDFRLLISNKVRKPFESIDLLKLKHELIQQSTRNQMGVYQIYNKNRLMELYNVISDAVHKGYEVRFQDQKLQSVLLGTGNVPIEYDSKDPFLGVGEDGKGSNIVGKILMQIRHNIRVRSHETKRGIELQSKYRNIYNIYLAYIILRREITDNKKQLNEYIGLTPDQIISKYGMENLAGGVPSQETIVDMYKKDNVPKVVMTEIYNPGTLTMNIRKMLIGQLRSQLLHDKNDIIFNSYIEYMLKGYDEKIDDEVNRQYDKRVKTGLSMMSKSKIRADIIEDIIARQKADISKDKLGKIKSRVIDLFKLGMLSASLSDKIDEEISFLQIPSEEDVIEAEIATIIPIVPNKKIDENHSDISSEGLSSSSPMTNIMKKIFKEDKEDKVNKKDLVDIIISIKGGNRSDYKDWSTNDLKQRLESLDKEENWDLDKDKDGIYVQQSGKPIIIFKDESKNSPELFSFNPESYTGMLLIDNMYFPTVQHYIIAKLIANTGTNRLVDSYGSISFKKGMGIVEAQKTILLNPDGSSDKPENFLNLKLAGEVYDNIERDTDIMLLSIYTATSLNKKFTDKGLQDLLILTGDSQINWDSHQNLYLGAKGKNYVGITMMDIREKIKETREGEEEVSISVKNLVRFINKDSFIMSWIEMRVNDMCGVVYKLQQYLKFKDGIDINLNEEERMIQLVKYVLDVIYQPCSVLVSLSNENTTEVPPFFIKIVDKCRGMVSGVAPVTTTDNKGNIKYSKDIIRKRADNEKEISLLESEFWGGTRIDHTIEESKEFSDNQRKEWSEFLKGLDKSSLEKNKLLKDFKQYQESEYNDFWGIEKGKKTRDEISRHEHKISELRKEFSTYLRKLEGVQRHFSLVSKEIAQIYWDRISVMLSTLIININPSTGSSIRDVIVKAEIMNSEKVNCLRIIANEQDNCIVSAIINLLTGIMKFKEEFSGNMDLDEDDVRLAGSIILNSKYTPKKVNEDYEEEEEGELEELEEDIFLNDESPQYSDNDDKYNENPYFEFKSKKLTFLTGDFDKIEQQIILINPNNSKNITTEIIKLIQTIKNSNISSKVKQNRINFFASIR